MPIDLANPPYRSTMHLNTNLQSKNRSQFIVFWRIITRPKQCPKQSPETDDLQQRVYEDPERGLAQPALLLLAV